MEINIGQVLTANKHMVACIFSKLLFVNLYICIYVNIDTECLVEDKLLHDCIFVCAKCCNLL